MTHLALRIAVPALAAALTLLPPSPVLAQAESGVSYATIDAIESSGSRVFWITGIIEGEAEPTRTSYFLLDADKTTDRCERYALLVMSKPGKYQMTLVNTSSSARCMLSVRAP